jgi:phosphoglycolate phosphatase/pyrophosphatase PpaX
MLRYPCLVLDHDDTVVQTERTIGFPYFRDYIERIRPGCTLTFEEYVRDCNNMVFADMCVQRWQMTEEEMHNEYLGWKAYSRANIPEVCPGIDRVIRRHKEAGGILCVSSLSTREIIERDFLHHFGMLPDAIYDYDLPPYQRKPNPYALEQIMEQFGLQPEEILMVDDMKLGCTMAQAVGVDTAFAAWSKTDFPKLTQEMRSLCRYSFDTPAQLEKFLFD